MKTKREKMSRKLGVGKTLRKYAAKKHVVMAMEQFDRLCALAMYGHLKKQLERRRVVLTVRQAGLLVACAALVDQKWGLTPMERLLVGAARRRVEKAQKG